jgi:hypothetical protein
MNAGKLLLGVGLIGGAAYLWKKNQEEKEALVDEGSDVPDYLPGNLPNVPPGWDEMVGLYQAAIYGQASRGDCTKLLAYIDSLQGETDQEDDWIAARRDEVRIACSEMYPDEPVPQLPGIAAYLQDALTRCWALQCSSTEVTELLRQLESVATFYSGQVPAEQIMTLRNASSVLNDRYNRVAGVAGAHVGNCGCEECQRKEEESVGACCEECATGVGACSCNKQKPEQVAGRA